MLARRRSEPKSLKVPETNPLAKYRKTDIAFQQRDGGVAASLSKLFGNAVVPATAYEALTYLTSSLRSADRSVATRRAATGREARAKASNKFPGSGEIWLWRVGEAPYLHTERVAEQRECAGAPFDVAPA